MRELKVKDWILVAVLAFGMGLAYPTAKDWLLGQRPAPIVAYEEPIDTPIQTDAFTISLLQAALKNQPEDNLTLIPNTLADLLNQMQPMASEDVAQELQKLNLPKNLLESSAPIDEAAFLFADKLVLTAAPANENSQQLCNEYIIHAPYASMPAEAIATINNCISACTDGKMGHLISGDDISTDTGIIAANAIHCAPEFEVPIRPADTRAADFYNANGRLPRIYMMHAYAQYYAKAPDGAWQAAALRLKGRPGSAELAPCYLILIRPAHSNSARTFAAELTADKLSAIRSALRESTLSCTAAFPRLSLRSGTINNATLLQQLGTEHLLTSADPFGKLTNKAPYPLSAILQRYSIELRESAHAAGAPPIPADTLECDHPFLWVLMPLSSPAAPYAMGIIENI